MNELKISVSKVIGKCTAATPLKPGDHFTICDGDIRIPEGNNVCLWALHSLIPLIPVKERETGEQRADDWMWRVHHAQCPDPAGRVIFKMEQVGEAVKESLPDKKIMPKPEAAPKETSPQPGGVLRDLRVVVKEVRGKCTSGMQTGDYFRLHSGLISIPPNRHFCLYALQAVLPFLAAKQRMLLDGDWLKDEQDFICPDPAGNVILRIELDD